MGLLHFVVAIIKVDFKESNCRLADLCVAGKYVFKYTYFVLGFSQYSTT